MATPLTRALTSAALIAAIASMTTTATAGNANTSPLGSVAAEARNTGTDDIPIYGQGLTLGQREIGDPMILSDHGVRRLEGGAIVYYSAGFPRMPTQAPTRRA